MICCTRIIKSVNKLQSGQLKTHSINLTTFNNEIYESRECSIALRPKNLNKSGLLPQHRNVVLKKIPYAQPHSWIHQSEKYQRKMFGRYGSVSGVNPRICFSTKLDFVEQTNYDKISHPDSLKDMVNKLSLEHAVKSEIIKQRDGEVFNKLEKLEQWKNELKDKIAKKEAETLAAKHRKERLVEEVRRHFGYKVDSRDERFKDLLELKEKEDKKKQKEAKRRAKEEKMVTKLVQKTGDGEK